MTRRGERGASREEPKRGLDDHHHRRQEHRQDDHIAQGDGTLVRRGLAAAHLILPSYSVIFVTKKAPAATAAATRIPAITIHSKVIAPTSRSSASTALARARPASHSSRATNSSGFMALPPSAIWAVDIWSGPERAVHDREDQQQQEARSEQGDRDHHRRAPRPGLGLG